MEKKNRSHSPTRLGRNAHACAVRRCLHRSLGALLARASAEPASRVFTSCYHDTSRVPIVRCSAGARTCRAAQKLTLEPINY